MKLRTKMYHEHFQTNKNIRVKVKLLLMNALKSCNKYKSPGCNGLPAEFYTAMLPQKMQQKLLM